MKQITTTDLRRMDGRGGLVLVGCGGDPQEWLDGINGLLTEAGILLNGSRFETAEHFTVGDQTNLLFPFDHVHLDMGKFATWRLRTHEQFGGTWLPDYVEARLGGFLPEQAAQKEKPDCQLIGQDGNIFNLMGVAAHTLRQNGMADQAGEMRERITGGNCHNYYDALAIIGEYVNITGPEGPDEDVGMELGGM